MITATFPVLVRVWVVAGLSMMVAGGSYGMAVGQPVDASDDRDVLSELNADYVRSVLTSDVARFEQILAADFRNTNADGSVVGREGFLAQVAKPSNLQSLMCDQVEIRIFGETAIIQARTVYTTSDGRPGTGRYTDIWVKQQGKWLAVAAHVTRLVR